MDTFSIDLIIPSPCLWINNCLDSILSSQMTSYRTISMIQRDARDAAWAPTLLLWRREATHSQLAFKAREGAWLVTAIDRLWSSMSQVGQSRIVWSSDCNGLLYWHSLLGAPTALLGASPVVVVRLPDLSSESTWPVGTGLVRLPPGTLIAENVAWPVLMLCRAVSPSYIRGSPGQNEQLMCEVDDQQASMI